MAKTAQAKPALEAPALRWPGGQLRAAQAKIGLSGGVVQRAATAAAPAPAAIATRVEVVRGEVPPAILGELDRMLRAAAAAGGAASADAAGLMGKLSAYLQSQDVPKPGSQGTFAVGASNFFDGVMTMATVGSAAFGSAMEDEAKVAHSVAQHDLGQRDRCVHGEVALIMAFPGLQAVLATQDCCLFCYGLLASRGYVHQRLRARVWPQTGWVHDYMGFRLTRVNMDINPKGNILAITWNGETAYFRVDPS